MKRAGVVACVLAYNRLLYRLAMSVADAPGTPKWRADSFFARFAAHRLP